MLKISAVIPTRGDCPNEIARIRTHLAQYPEIVEVIVIPGDTVFNRYRAAFGMAKESLIYTQDDDCITDLRPLIKQFQDIGVETQKWPRQRQQSLFVNAMTEAHAANYRGRNTLVGFGSIFQRPALQAFTDWPWERDELFYRECDRIFATVNPHTHVIQPVEIFESAHAPNRMWKDPLHNQYRVEIEKRIRETTGY